MNDLIGVLAAGNHVQLEITLRLEAEKGKGAKSKSQDV